MWIITVEKGELNVLITNLCDELFSLCEECSVKKFCKRKIGHICKRVQICDLNRSAENLLRTMC